MHINNPVLQTTGPLTLTASQFFQTNTNTSDIIKRRIFCKTSRINTKIGRVYALLHVLFYIVGMAWVPFGTAHADTIPPSPVKWHPGHYYTIMGDKNNAAYMAKVYGELESTRALRGVQIRFNWAELEPSEGVYVYNSIDKHLHALSSRNKRLVILLQLKTFDPSSLSVLPLMLPTTRICRADLIVIS